MEHWFFFFVFTQLLMVFSGFSFFTHHPLFYLPATSLLSRLLSPHTIVSPSTVLLFDEVSEGPGYSSRGIKVCEIERVSVFVCVFSEPCSGWPVPDDQEPRRFSWWPRRTGDRVQKRLVPHVSPVDFSVSLLLFFFFYFKTCYYYSIILIEFSFFANIQTSSTETKL